MHFIVRIAFPLESGASPHQSYMVPLPSVCFSPRVDGVMVAGGLVLICNNETEWDPEDHLGMVAFLSSPIPFFKGTNSSHYDLP